MGPKRPKAAAAAAAASSGPAAKSWEAALVAAALEEDNWKPSIAFVVGTKIEDEIHTTALSLAVQVPQRKLFSVVTREDIFRQIAESGNQKGKKIKDVPMFYEGRSINSDTSKFRTGKSRKSASFIVGLKIHNSQPVLTGI